MPDPTEGHRTVVVQQSVMAHNAALARELRSRFATHGVLVVNVLSSPGSGKTALLERTLTELGASLRMAVVVGDLQTDNDARRLGGRGAAVVQIVTGTVCHLEADMVARAIEGLDLASLDVLFIENVGNMVCPAGYDLGESVRVALLSVTEGEDKPLKYPVLFQTADLVVVSKVDISEAVGFDRQAALSSIGEAAPGAHIVEVSARTGEGMDTWYEALRSAMDRAQAGGPPSPGTEERQ